MCSFLKKYLGQILLRQIARVLVIEFQEGVSQMSVRDHLGLHQRRDKRRILDGAVIVVIEGL